MCTLYKWGLQMVNFFSYLKALKASWVNRLVHPSPANWKLIPQKYFGVLGKNWLIFKLNLDNKKILDWAKIKIILQSIKLFENVFKLSFFIKHT